MTWVEVLSWIELVALGLLSIAAPIIALVRRAEVRSVFASGLRFSLVAHLLLVPTSVVLLVYADDRVFDALFASHGLAPSVVLVASIVGTAVSFVWLAVLFGVVAILRGRRPPFPRGADAPAGWWLAAVVGVLLAVATEIVFDAMGVVPHPDLVALRAVLFPGLDEAPAANLVALVPLVVSIAMFEELLFRGFLQRGLASLWPSRAGRATAIALTTALWTIGHGANTLPGEPKLVQIAIAGVFFGWLAEARGVPAAIVGHAALNVAAVVASVLTGSS